MPDHDDSAPTGPQAEEHLDGEAPVETGSELDECAAEAILALTKASRASLLYDADNEAVAGFLSELNDRFGQALRHGELVLEVQPGEIVRDGRVVYRNPDREKSLAARLYNDGVRKLIFSTGLTWDELVRLVEILTIRFSGIRQQEDDIVTLIWKTRFEHIGVVSVDSWVAEDSEGGGEARRTDRVGAEIEAAPYAFDYPWPQLSRTAPVRFRQVPTASLEELHREQSPDALPELCRQLVARLAGELEHPTDPLDPEPVVAFIRDMRDYFVSDGNAPLLLAMVRTVMALEASADARSRLLEVFTERPVLAAMIDAAIAQSIPAEPLGELVRAVPDDTLEAVFGVLDERWSGAGRDLGLRLIDVAFEDRIDDLTRLAADASGVMAADLLAHAAERSPAAALELALTSLKRDDAGLQLKALEIIHAGDYRSEVGRALTRCLASDHEAVRVRAARILAAKGERRAFEPIAEMLHSSGGADMSPGESAVLGASLAALDGARALELFRVWVTPSGWLDRFRPTRGPMWWPAMYGLARIPGAEAARLLRFMHDKSSDDFQARCAKAVAAQERLGSGAGDE